MDIANQGDMYQYINGLPTDKDRLEACEECIRQLLPVLTYLKKPEIGFMHNDLKLKNVFVHKGDNKKVFYRLADFDKSAISWRCIRFYNNSKDYVSCSVPHRGMDPATLSGGTCSKVTRNTDLIGKTVMVSTMFNAEGYYLGYDLYTLVASMLFHPGVYSAFLTERGFMSSLINAMNIGDRSSQFMSVIRTYMEADDRKTHGETLQSITAINGVLHKNSITIRNDCDNIMRELKVAPFKPSLLGESFYAVTSDKSIRPILSKTGKICLSTPYVEEGQRRCKTPAYRGWAGTYQYDEI